MVRGLTPKMLRRQPGDSTGRGEHDQGLVGGFKRLRQDLGFPLCPVESGCVLIGLDQVRVDQRKHVPVAFQEIEVTKDSSAFPRGFRNVERRACP
jgi:hypothetical protein